MLRVLGSPKQMCDGVTRRDLLTAGSVPMLGLTLPDLLQADQNATARSGKAKSVIVLYLFGGPAKHEGFDPKPDAGKDIQGPFGSIPTDLPGIHYSELYPKMAKWLHRSALVRSATHPHNDHSAGLLYTVTGKKAKKLESKVPVLPTQAPSMNSVMQYLGRNEARELPESVWMPCYPGWGQKSLRPGPFGGFLGRQLDPLITECKLEETRVRKDFYDASVQKGHIVLPSTKLPDEITLDRLDQRRSLLEQFNDQQRRIDQGSATERLDHYKQQAFNLLAARNSPNSAWRAFDLDEESDKTRDRYGRFLYGEASLIARRLVQRGVRLVTLYWESFHQQDGDAPAWDTHRNHFNIVKDYRAPVVDQIFTALCEDMEASGLLDETLLVVMGEMGRTPKPNGGAGRDHWSYCYDVLFTGSGIKQGVVYGESDKIGAWPKSDPVGPEAIIATIYEAMGIDSSGVIYDQANRPHPIAQHGKPIWDILA
ncbi:MAG: hypothetical protein CMJ78_26815 [Planctomycetaceae bacterium]|nr:hypothetical protein [Planctomycetaceae bacterium]